MPKETEKPSNYQRLIAIADLPENGKQRFQINGFDLLICRVAARCYVLHNQCSHQREPLHQGRIRGNCIYCPYHGARFNLESGAPESAPATEAIRIYAHRIVDGYLEAALS